MKRRLFVLFIICFFVLITPVFASDDISYDRVLSKSNIIDITSYKNGYVLLSGDGEVSKYGLDDNLVTSKKLNSIKARGLLRFNDSFIVYGVSDNLVSIYILDIDLRVVHNSTLDIMVNDSVIKPYIKSDNVYFILSLDNVISSTKIVTMDQLFNIEISNLSEFTELKDILKSDYYLFNDGSGFNKSVVLDDNNYLIGNNTFKRVEDNLTKEDDKYTYLDMIVCGNRIVVLGKSDEGNSLLIYDKDGNVISNIEVDGNVLRLDKFNKYLAIICTDKILLYDYELEIDKEDSLFGSLTIEGNAIPYGEISVSAIGNSGYEIEKIVVKSSIGEEILVTGNKFIMPEDNVKVSVIYKEVVKNPETFDAILLISVLAIILLIVGRTLYVNYKWLK